MFGGLCHVLEPDGGAFFRKGCHKWTVVSGAGGGSRGEWAVPVVSFTGMFNFHSLFLKSNFLQRHEE